jgi:lipoprotein-anchoring transpeptidase ErfK/SrfK
MTEDSKMVRVGGHGTSAGTGRLWRIALFALAGAISTASGAEAAAYYWSGYDPGYYYYLPPPAVPQRARARRPQAKRIEAPVKESTKPQGPLIIAISIEKQSLKIYDANGFFTETPISTGMRGHPTPMGVFSIIQKHKFHHSNIYSNAPMPYMQRITWSGVAMHAGVLPGYPASHGCIRMPMTFAVKMWNWTKMGARVVVTPGEITPVGFSHPLLATKRVLPKPVAANEPQADAPAAQADKAAAADAASKPVIAEASLELRSTLGHDNSVKPAIADQAAATSLRVETRTAYASGDMPAAKASATMSDAAPGAKSETAKSAAKPTAATIESTPSEPAKSEPGATAAKRSEVTSSDARPADAAKPEDAATEGVKAEEKPEESIKAGTDISPGAPDAKQDQARTPDKKATAPKPDPAANATTPKRAGQIAALISRKDSRLYVRQNFSALFDVPVTIAPSDRPLGTHVFTVRVDKDDASVLRWSVVSLPAPARYTERRDEEAGGWRRRKIAGAVEIKALPVANSAAEALDRLTIPADAMARITEALSTGGSIIVSDQGITAGETGEGTDFIVSLR